MDEDQDARFVTCAGCGLMHSTYRMRFNIGDVYFCELACIDMLMAEPEPEPPRKPKCSWMMLERNRV